MTYEDTLEALDRAIARAEFVAKSGCWPQGRFMTNREFESAYASVKRRTHSEPA